MGSHLAPHKIHNHLLYKSHKHLCEKVCFGLWVGLVAQTFASGPLGGALLVERFPTGAVNSTMVVVTSFLTLVSSSPGNLWTKAFLMAVVCLRGIALWVLDDLILARLLMHQVASCF